MKVLVGVDGSVESDHAVALAGKLLSGEADEVVLYYSPPLVKARGIDESSRALLEETRKALAERVFARARGFLPEALQSRAVTVLGTRKAGQGILMAAAQQRPDMIAVGARGASQIAKMLLGSVSRAVMHGAGVPVLIARIPEHRTDTPRVLVACDRTGISGEATGFVRRLSWPTETAGYVLHVRESVFHGPIPNWLMEEISRNQPEPPLKVWIDEEERESQEAVGELAAVCRDLPPPFCGVRPTVLKGHPGEQIVAFIESNKINLVIVGARIQWPIARMMGGSTSDYVLAHAGCSVLVVPHHEAP